MATKKAAESTLYHLSPKGFWKKFRDNVVVNPELSSGLPLQSKFRRPAPGSRPEKYSTPATKASDPAENPYWKRDVRRAYPQLSIVTQRELSSLLLEHSRAAAVAAPGAAAAAEGTSATPAEVVPVDLTVAISTVAQSKPVFSESKLPPSLPSAHKPWRPQLAEPAPHHPDAYFPMLLYK